MYNVINYISGLTVCGGSRRFDASALVDCHIDNHSAGWHPFQVFVPDQPGSARAWNQHGSNQKVRMIETIENIMAIAEQRGHVARHDIVQIAQTVEIDVQNRNVGSQTGGYFGGVGPNNAASQNYHIGGKDPRHATQKDAAAF